MASLRQKLSGLLPPVPVTLVFIALTLTLCAWGSAMLSDPDTGWHIAVGDQIRATGSVHLQEIFSFSAKGHPWQDTAWLWDIGQSWIHQHAGLQGVLALAAALVAALCAGITWRCLALRAGLVSTLLITITVMVTLVSTARPHTVTFLLTLAAASLLADVRQRPERRRRLAWLPVMMVLWVNVHGGFMIMFTLIGAYGLDALFRTWRHPAWREVWALAGAGLACMAAVLVNPYGVGVLSTVTDMMQSGAHSFIMEWQPMQLTLSNLLFIFPIPLFFLMIRPRDPRFTLAEKLLGFFWLGMAAGALRHYAIFLILSAPMLAVAMQPYFAVKPEKKAGWEPAMRLGRKIGMGADTARVRAGALALALMAAFACGTPAAERYYYDEPLALPLHKLDGAIDYILAHYPQVHFFNEYSIGGYIVYKTRGALPVFIDGREQPAYTPRVIADYIAYRTGEPDWQERLARYGVGGLFLLAGNHNANNVTHPPCSQGWTLVYSDKFAHVYVKDALVHSAVAAK